MGREGSERVVVPVDVESRHLVVVCRCRRSGLCDRWLAGHGLSGHSSRRLPWCGTDWKKWRFDSERGTPSLESHKEASTSGKPLALFFRRGEFWHPAEAPLDTKGVCHGRQQWRDENSRHNRGSSETRKRAKHEGYKTNAAPAPAGGIEKYRRSGQRSGSGIGAIH